MKNTYASALVWLVVCAGLIALRESVGLHRKDKGFFRSGPVVLVDVLPLPSVPSSLPSLDSLRAKRLPRYSAHRLEDGEIAIASPGTGTPLLQGLFSIDADRRALVVTARLILGLRAVSVLGGATLAWSIPAIGWSLAVGVIGLSAREYVSEVRNLRAIAAALVQSLGDTETRAG